MKKIHLLTTSAAAVGLMLTAACTDQVDFTQESLQQQAAASVDDGSIQFSTYLGNSVQTRAGWQGSISDTELKTNTSGANGFGVFAYYTGNQTYSQAQYGWDGSALKYSLKPNFMYNQHVYWQTGAEYEGYVNGNGASGASAGAWIYSPIKYWPNEIGTNAISTEDYRVDDQDDDQAALPATTKKNGYGGNVSFFAYAPYVFVNTSGVPTDGATNYGPTETKSGIVRITSNTDDGDPKITYVIASGNDVKQVDLLWGTYKGTKENAVSESSNVGVAGDGDKSNDAPTAADQYSNAILGNYKLNADLTKQKTTGTIGFNFKHALAKVGGSNTHTTGATGAKHGFMVVLDLDDMKGNETGGNYTNTGLSTGTQTTKVTINSIEVIARSKVAVDDGGGNTVYRYLKQNQGVFNLATGQWDILKTTGNLLSEDGTSTPTTDDDAAATMHIINTTGTNASATLASGIAEPASVTAWSSLATVEGVTTVPKNVYGTESNPLVFIPGTQAELYVTADYYVRTKDDNLSKGYSEVHQKITKKVTFVRDLELNKQYSLLMHIGLTGVKFTASVADWDINTADPNFDSNDDGYPDIHVDDVYVPMNVSELLGASSSSPTTASGSQNHATLQLDQIALNYSDDTDDITVGKDEFTSKGLTFTSSDGTNASVTAGGLITFTENPTASARTFTITITRGNQSADITVTQPAPTLNSITMTISEHTVDPAAGGPITPTVIAAYENTNGSPNTSINPVVTESATYEVDGTPVSLLAGKLNVPSGTSGETIRVKATYDGKVSEIYDDSALKYADPSPAKRR